MRMQASASSHHPIGAVNPAVRSGGQIKREWVFYLFVASAALGIAVSYGAFYLFHIAFAGYLLMVLGELARGHFRIRTGTRYHFFLLLFYLWYVVSILWASNIIYAVYYIGYLTCGIGIVFAIAYEVKTLPEIEKVVKVLSVCFAIEIVVSLLEALTPFRYPISPFSPYAGLFDRPYQIPEVDNPFALSVIAVTPTGFAWNPNNLAAILVILAPFVSTIVSRKWRWVWWAAIAVVVFFTGSRASFLGLLLAIALGFANRSLIRLLLLVGTAVLTWIAVPAALDSLKDHEGRIGEIAGTVSEAIRFFSEEDDQATSLGTRQRLIKNGIQAIIETNGLGVGAGGSKTVQEEFGTTGKITSMHNFWVEICVDAGVYIGFLFILWYIGLFVRVLMISRSGIDPKVASLARACAIALAAFSIAAVSASSTIYVLPMWLLFGFSIAVINVSSKAEQKLITFGR